MNNATPFFSQPLNLVFGAASHVALLRALKDSAEGMSGRAAARVAGLSQEACRQAIERLETAGLIRRQGAGHTQLVKLNFDNVLVATALLPLFLAEKSIYAQLTGDIRSALGTEAKTLTVFGSAARGEERPGSDLDLLLLAEGRGKAKLAADAQDYSRKFAGKYGIRLSPITYSVAEARARYKSGDPLLRNILEQGTDLAAVKLREVLL